MGEWLSRAQIKMVAGRGPEKPRRRGKSLERMASAQGPRVVGRKFVQYLIG